MATPEPISIDHLPIRPEDAALARELLEVALRAATDAVTLIHTNRPATLQVQDKSSGTDHVTEMDTASEAAIRSVIAELRPDDLIVGEEGGDDQPDGSDPDRVTWWVDPIDGTTNYVYDHPGYNVSIAASLGGLTLAGVVGDPTHARTYSATRGGGAHCNGTPLSIGPPPPIERALIATGFAYDSARRGRQGHVVADLLPHIRDIRRMGAAAMDLCSVAAGRVDAYYECGLADWDLAAGALIATEAGARVGSLDGGPLSPAMVLATHPELFEPLRSLLVDLGATDV